MTQPSATPARSGWSASPPLAGPPRWIITLLWLPVVLFLIFAVRGQQVSPTWLYAGLVPAVGGWLAFALQPRLPVLRACATVAALAGGGLMLLIGSHGWTTSAAFPMLAAFVAGIRLPGRWAIGATTLIAAATVVVVGPYDSPWDAAMVAVSPAVLLLFGMARRDAMRRAEEHERALVADARAREEHARAEAIADRARVARDVHDVLAHSLSALAVHLQGARLMALRDGAAADTIAQIERAQNLAGDGISEARRAVRALREGPAPVDVAAELHELAAAHPDATVELDPGVRLGAREGETVLRAAQEALSNARKHAPGAPVTVRLHPEGAGVVVLEVLDVSAGSPPGHEAPAGDGQGFGLTGMAERAALVGATLDVGPTADGWRVALRVPAVASPDDGPAAASAPEGSVPEGFAAPGPSGRGAARRHPVADDRGADRRIGA